MLEQEVQRAVSIYSGRITRISKNLDGTYKIAIQAEQTLKGDDITGEALRYTIPKDCVYPFQKDHSYTFVMSEQIEDRGTLAPCSVVINTADIETMQQINQWLNRPSDPSNPNPDPGGGDEQDEPTPTVNGARYIFDALVTQLSSIRIEEENYRTWFYDDTASLFFYSPTAKISFFVPITQSITDEDYDQFTRGISISRASDGKKVAFALGEVSLDVKELPIVIKLFDAPAQDIMIRFTAPGSEEVFEAKVQYTTPFSYAVTSGSDPGVERYVELLKSGFQAAYHVLNGQTHSFTIRFNHPVDRGSVYEKLNDSFQHRPTVAWSMQWVNDYEVKLSLTPDDESYESIQFTLNGVSAENGYKLIAREQFVIQPSEPVVFQAIDMETDTKEVYFTSMTPYASIDVSPSGSYVLVGYEGHNGMHTVYQYILRDRFGNMMKSFDMDEVHHPHWITDSKLAYVSGQEIKTYDLSTEEDITVWQTPGTHDEEKIVSFDHSIHTSNLAIGVGYKTDAGDYVYDLVITEGLQADELVTLEAFGSYECLEGRCIAPSILFTEDHRIMYNRWEAAAWDDIGGYLPILYETDLDSQTTTRIDPIGDINPSGHLLFPLSDGTVLVIADASTIGVFPDDLSSAREQWSIYDPDTAQFNLLFETDIGLFMNNWIEQLIPSASRQLLLDIYGLGWYVLDLDDRILQRYQALSEPIDMIDIEMGRIWFME